MKSKEKYALSLLAIDNLYKKESWCGETHIQKNMYMIEVLAAVPTGLNFILYKHGPYSFDLHDIVSDMRSLGFLELEQIPPYGPRIRVTQAGHEFLNKNNSGKYDQQIDNVTSLFCNHTVQGLEKLATSLMIFTDNPSMSLKDRANYLHKIKPHISVEEAIEAATELSQIKKNFN